MISRACGNPVNISSFCSEPYTLIPVSLLVTIVFLLGCACPVNQCGYKIIRIYHECEGGRKNPAVRHKESRLVMPTHDPEVEIFLPGNTNM